jgi:hypothetical protein
MEKGQSAAKLLNKKKLDEKYLNNTFGNIRVFEYSHKKGYRSYYKGECLRCGKTTSLRTDHLLREPKSCTHCVNDLQKEIADLKYSEYRKYKTIYNRYKGNARYKNRDFNLTLKDVIKFVDSECYYCGDKNSQGIDRINSKLGYTIENTLPCCKICNQMKHVFTNDEFFNKIHLIYNKHLKESSTTIL